MFIYLKILAIYNMFWLYVGIIIFSSIMLVILGLLQHSKKENSSGSVLESSNFGQFVGIKKTGDILENMTLTFIFLVFYLSILSYRDLTAERRRNLSFSNVNNIENETNNGKDNNSTSNDVKKDDKKDTKEEVKDEENKKN